MLEEWLNKQLSMGKMSFSLSQLKKTLTGYSDIAIKRALNRLSKKGKVLSIYKGYYLIIPPQYASRGILPVNLFIDGLMNYMERKYYMGLLSAAAIHGAAHQQPQESYVITTPPPLRPTVRKGIRINYVIKNNIPESHIIQHKTETGYIKLSTPELTALDLLQYEKRSGGLDRIGTILNELIEAFDQENINRAFIRLGPASSIQRLGYMLEHVVEGEEYADKLFNTCQKAGLKFNRTPLEGSEPVQGFSSKNRWNIIVNTAIEIDE